MEIDIIGAGIGGLTTALALEQKGFSVRIFEQAEQIKRIGAGIILANNAMQVFDKLGLSDILEANGNPISTMKITRPNLQVISEMNLASFEEKHGVKNIAIHRGTLQEILMNSLKSTKIYLGHKLDGVRKKADGYSLTFANGEQVISSTLIGADGLNSAVRDHLFPGNALRHANQVCWRGIVSMDLPKEYRNELNEAWGKSGRFGFVQIEEGKVYWYALKSFKTEIGEFSLTGIEQYFEDFNVLVRQIIHGTDQKRIHTTEISDLKPTSVWCNDNVCLMGDAAHAATPNMGQGACQAIEDAFALSECLERFDTNTAFRTFQALRLPKAQQVVKTSWMIGKMAHLSNPVVTGFRNLILRLTPFSIKRKQNEQLFQLVKIPEV